jgi:hypothetical protein
MKHQLNPLVTIPCIMVLVLKLCGGQLMIFKKIINSSMMLCFHFFYGEQEP